MQLRISITIAMVEIRNRKTLQSKVNICKSDVKIGDYVDSLLYDRLKKNSNLSQPNLIIVHGLGKQVI